MADLRHVKTFENYTTPVVGKVEEDNEEELNEGLFDQLKTKIDKFLDDPNDGKVDKILKSAFAKSFSTAPKTKAEVLALDNDKKIDILKKASIKLSDPKIGVLKIIKRSGVWEVGGVPLVAGTGGGHRS